MAFEFSQSESVAQGFRRLLDEWIGSAISSLQKEGPGLGQSVHEAHKRCKEIRALLKLVKDQLADDAYPRENGVFRNIGRPLSEIRDGYALVEALDELVKASNGAIKARVAKAFRKRLIDQRQAARRRIIDKDRAIERTVRALISARKRVPELRLEDKGFAALSSGLRRTYRDGLEAMRQVKKTPEDELFHAWRKRVKDLRYHLQLLTPIKPNAMKPLEASADKLGKMLGDDHDLTLLQKRAAEGNLNAKDRDALVDAARQQQSHRRKQAMELGEKLYAASPVKFIKQIKRHWKQWRQSNRKEH